MPPFWICPQCRSQDYREHTDHRRTWRTCTHCGTVTGDCDTCRNMHPELMVDGCAAPEFIAMAEAEQHRFWTAAIVPCTFFRRDVNK